MYSITTPDRLRELCIKEGWFECGTLSQYDKLFEMNRIGTTPLEIMCTIIWICSDSEFSYIYAILSKEQARYQGRIDWESFIV